MKLWIVWSVNNGRFPRADVHTVVLTMVTLRDGRHADADALLFGDRMDGVLAVDVAEGQAEVLLHGSQAKVFGVQVDQGAQQSCGTLLAEVLAAPQALLLHPTPQGAWREQGRSWVHEKEAKNVCAQDFFLSSYNIMVQSQRVRMWTAEEL